MIFGLCGKYIFLNKYDCRQFEEIRFKMKEIKLRYNNRPYGILQAYSFSFSFFFVLFFYIGLWLGNVFRIKLILILVGNMLYIKSKYFSDYIHVKRNLDMHTNRIYVYHKIVKSTHFHDQTESVCNILWKCSFHEF